MGCVLTFIAVMDRNRVMASKKGVPWDLPADRAHFRAYTASQWLLVGRRTYLEMLGWFQPGQTPLVLTSDGGFDPPVGRRVASTVEALALAAQAGAGELVHLGGASAFQEAMPYAGRMILTRVEGEEPPSGDLKYFPAWSESDWTRKQVRYHAADRENAYAFQVETWERFSV